MQRTILIIETALLLLTPAVNAAVGPDAPASGRSTSITGAGGTAATPAVTAPSIGVYPAGPGARNTPLTPPAASESFATLLRSITAGAKTRGEHRFAV